MSNTAPCPWCGTEVRMLGYRSPVEHPCDFSLACGAPTSPQSGGLMWWAAVRKCRNPKSQPDGFCWVHSSIPAVIRDRSATRTAWSRPTPRPPALNVAIHGDYAETLRQSADAAGVTPAHMVRMLIANHLQPAPSVQSGSDEGKQG